MKSSHRLVNRRTRNLAIALAISGVTSVARAQDRSFFINGPGKWETSGNWSLQGGQTAPPANNSAFNVHVGNGGNTLSEATFDPATMAAYVAGGTLTSGAPLHVGYLVVGDGSPSQGTLDFNGGTLNVATQFAMGGWFNNSGGVGTLKMTGGRIDVSASTGSMTLGYQNGTSAAGASHGTVIMSGGEIDYGGTTMSVGCRESTGAFIMTGGLLSGTGIMTIGGSTISSPGTSTTAGAGSFTMSGTAELVSGQIIMNTGRPNNFLTPSDVLSVSGGTLSVGSIGQGAGSANLLCSVSFTGGTVIANTFRMALNQQGGTLSPGIGGVIDGGTNNVGSINLLEDAGKQAGDANYTQASGAHLLLDLTVPNADPTLATNDVVHLEANGLSGGLTANLGGEIDIHVGYTPAVGDTFNVLTADTIVATATKMYTVNDANYIFGQNKTTGTIPTNATGGIGSGSILQVTMLGYAHLGDATDDQTVNSADFDALAANFGAVTGVGWHEGDFNHDGIVNALDFNALATNYGQTGYSLTQTADIPDDAAPAAALGSLVPEPMSATILLGAAGLGLLGRKRRR